MGITYVEFEDEAGVLRRYRKHVNGRGLVATTAKVDKTAFVDPTAYVDPGAEVKHGAQIGPGAWIDRDAIVAERAVVGVNVHVGPRAVIGRNAVLGPYANIALDAVGALSKSELIGSQGVLRTLGRCAPVRHHERVAAERALVRVHNAMLPGSALRTQPRRPVRARDAFACRPTGRVSGCLAVRRAPSPRRA